MLSLKQMKDHEKELNLQFIPNNYNSLPEISYLIKGARMKVMIQVDHFLKTIVNFSYPH